MDISLFVSNQMIIPFTEFDFPRHFWFAFIFIAMVVLFFQFNPLHEASFQIVTENSARTFVFLFVRQSELVSVWVMLYQLYDQLIFDLIFFCVFWDTMK